MNKILKKSQEKNLKRKQEKESENRYFSRNWKAMTWCNEQGLTIYTSAQSHNSDFVRIFVHKGVHFKPLNNIFYSQTDLEDIIKCVSAIDVEYERLYNKMNK
jgi:hypothetical protein